MSISRTKAVRLQQIELILLQHPTGMTQAELARRLDVNRSTISRNISDIQGIYEDGGKLFIDRRSNLVNLRLNIYEALSLHLASRLLTNNLDRQNSHAASALRKMSEAVLKLAPEISKLMSASAEIIEKKAGLDQTGYMQVMEVLADGWALGRKVRLVHRANPKGQAKTYDFSVYYLEPGAWGRSTYVIGLREPPGEVRTLKVERVERAELLETRYALPAGFDAFRLLEDAWGIWYTGKAPVEVRLRFSAQVAGRVMETIWHRSQEITPEADGRLLWTAQVAEPKEMEPWIRGWGSDVEVLSPPALRESVAADSRRSAAYYG